MTASRVDSEPLSFALVMDDVTRDKVVSLGVCSLHMM
jgi:hypothetical protein